MHPLVCAYRRKDETARFYCARVVGLQAIDLWPKSFNNAAAGCSESRTRAHGCEMEVAWRSACGVWKRHLSVKRHSARDAASRPGPCGLVMRNLSSVFSARPMMTPCDWKKTLSHPRRKEARTKREGQGRQSCIFKVTQASAFAFPSEAALGESKKKKKRKKRSD